jgi:hypothetical protein
MWRKEDGRAGPAILLGLVGAAVCAPLGFVLGGLLAGLTVCRNGGGAMGESCGMAAIIFSGLGVPIGALMGGIAGAVIGSRRPRASRPDAATSAGPPAVAGPPVHREASAASWLAVVAGLAITFGASRGWRTVYYSYADRFEYRMLLTAVPEAIGFLGGITVLVGATLRVLRPAAPAPTLLIGTGTALALAGVVWGYVDLLDVPATLDTELFVGYWMSLVGVGLGIAGWWIDRDRRRITATPTSAWDR